MKANSRRLWKGEKRSQTQLGTLGFQERLRVESFRVLFFVSYISPTWVPEKFSTQKCQQVLKKTQRTMEKISLSLLSLARRLRGQCFSIRDDFVPQDMFGNVWRHLWWSLPGFESSTGLMERINKQSIIGIEKDFIQAKLKTVAPIPPLR